MERNNNVRSIRRGSAITMAKKQRKTRTIILLGSPQSGKTMLVKRFLGDPFTEEYTPTVEDCYNRDIKHNGFDLNLDIIDMCGASMFPAMYDLNVKSADIIMLTYEIDNSRSVKEACDIYRKVHRLRSNTLTVEPSTSNVPIILVGTKLDLHTEHRTAEEYEITSNFDTSFRNMKVKHILTSAKYGKHVTDSFELGLDCVVSRINALSMSAIREEKHVKKSCCTIL